MEKDITRLPHEVLNIRFLLKRKGVTPDRWAERLVEQTRRFIKLNRALQIIEGAQPTDEELDVIAEHFDREAEEFRVPIYGRGAATILKENLAFLRQSLPRGSKKDLANRLGVKQSTISRWGKAIETPEKKNLRGILKYFQLDPDLDLVKVPLFLTLHPIGGQLQKKWLKQRLDDIAPEDLNSYFPALQRILRKDETD